jgi:hypothetical protein
MPGALSEAASQLLIAVSEDPGGVILRLTPSGASALLKTNGRLFGDGSPRAQSGWESALRQLLLYALIELHGDQGRVLCITSDGYDAADALSGRRSR